jgi:hypothetical protein
MNRITSAQISVVVQGPVMGKPFDPPEKQITREVLQSIRRHLPQAEIILSTWTGSDVAGLDFDLLVENQDPGAIPFFPGQPQVNNGNRLIFSTKEGLKKASRPYALKLRSDLSLDGDGFLDYFSRFPARSSEWKIARERVLACTLYARDVRYVKMPFHPRDWFFFGLKEDVLEIWDVALMPEPENTRWFEAHPKPPQLQRHKALLRYHIEQYLWLNYLHRHAPVACEHFADVSGDNIRLTELTFSNNLILLEPEQLCISFHRLPLPFGERITLYTHRDWLWFYKRYCDPGFDFDFIKAATCAGLLKFLRYLHRAMLMTGVTAIFEPSIRKIFYWLSRPNRD